MIPPFENNELCDGKHCSKRDFCARCMMRPDIDLAKCTPYVNFNCKPISNCAFFLPIPSDFYPSK